MPIKCYTTKIKAEQTVAEIQQKLARAGAIQTTIRYNDQRRAAGIRFHLDLGVGQYLPFVLAPNVPGCLSALKADNVEAKYQTPEHAEKVAWRLILNYVDVQIAFFEAHQATALAQLFLGMGLVQTDQNDGQPPQMEDRLPGPHRGRQDAPTSSASPILRLIPMQQPQTRNEWQHAAKDAHALLLIDASKAYGLTTRGPDIDTDRCDKYLKVINCAFSQARGAKNCTINFSHLLSILHRAEALGITPTDELIEPLLAELT